MNDNLTQAYAILDEALATYHPAHIFGLFSGGNDSLVTMWMLSEWARLRARSFEVVHINTGIGIEQTRVFVRETCLALAWPLREYKTDPQRYVDMVLGRVRGVPGGFPGAPLHSIYYTRLKDRQIAQLLRDVKRHRSERVMLVTGLRQQESRKRMGYTQPVQKQGAAVWANPLFHWSTDDLLDVRERAQLPRSTVADCLHMSGECLCGSYNSPGELDLIRFFYPETAARIDAIAEQVACAGYPWGWDEPRPKWYTQVRDGQEFLDGFSPLCSSCQWRREKVTNATD